VGEERHRGDPAGNSMRTSSGAKFGFP
jgi:hypothetical protein